MTTDIRQGSGRSDEQLFRAAHGRRLMCAMPQCPNRAVGLSNYCDQHRPSTRFIDEERARRFLRRAELLDWFIFYACAAFLIVAAGFGVWGFFK